MTKADLLGVISAGYKAGYGPRDIARMTGKSYQTIQGYATALGLRVGSTRPKVIPEHEGALYAALLQAGCITR